MLFPEDNFYEGPLDLTDMFFWSAMRFVFWPMSRSRTVSPAVYVELIGLLFTVRLPILVLGGVFGFLGIVIAPRAGDPVIAVIAALGVAVTVLRLVVHTLYQRKFLTKSPAPADARFWERRYAAGGIATAMLVGAFGARALMLPDITIHMLAVSIVFGYGAGVVTRCSIRPGLTIGLLYLAVIAPVISAILHFDVPHVALGVLFLAFMFGSFETVSHLYVTTVDQLTLKQQFAELARQDPLTGLPNRLMLKEGVEAALVKNRRNRGVVALHSVDLDHFKEANDRFGHPVGDALLKAVAKRLTRLLREGDLIARLGGDEFILVQVGVNCREEADILARRAVRALSSPFVIDGHKIRIGGSVGIALAPHDGTTLEELLVTADGALYSAKRSRSSFAFVDDAPPLQDEAIAS
jgi:diguanylate cyclase (GGDEF)-like protein